MENSTITLGQVSEKIDFLAVKIEQFFKTMNAPDNIMIKKDAHWGRRHVNLFLRLDEFSLNRLKEHLPQLESLFAEYTALREQEKSLNDAALIERTIQHQNLSINPEQQTY